MFRPGGERAHAAHQARLRLSTSHATPLRHTADFTAAGVALTATMRVRFTANDADPQSIVEAGIDAVDLSVLTCDPCPCACDFDTSTGVGVCDLIDFVAFAGLFSTGDPCACDIDTSTGPGVCDLIDFVAFAGQFASGCP